MSLSGRRKLTLAIQYRKFTETLRKTRENAGLSQSQAAVLLGVPQSFISKCESGERRVDVVELTLFCVAYDASILSFIKEIQGS